MEREAEADLRRNGTDAVKMIADDSMGELHTFFDWLHWTHTTAIVDRTYRQMPRAEFERLERPANLRAAVEFSEDFATRHHIPYLRVDFLLVNALLYFTETSLTPGYCIVHYEPDLFQYSVSPGHPNREHFLKTGGAPMS